MLMQVSTAGIVHDSTLASGPLELVRFGLWPLALVVVFTTALAPFAKHAGMLYVLIGLRTRRPLPRLGRVFLFSRRMGLWAMLEVLMLGVFVAYTKLGDLVHVEVGAAVMALGALTIVALWADTALDPDAVWEAIERRGRPMRRCPRIALSSSTRGWWPARPAGWSASTTPTACAAARRCIRASPTASTEPGR
jgi:paraquat-inducible protein A